MIINNNKVDIIMDSNSEQNVNINQNRALLNVEIDGEQIDLIQNENPSRKNSTYGKNYINMDYTEFSSKKRKKFIDKFRESAVKNFKLKNEGKLPQSTKINSFNLRGKNKISILNIKENEESFNSDNNKNNYKNTNLKNTCFYKTSYLLNKFDNQNN